MGLFGKMVVHRGEPYTNDQGRRQIDFSVRSWEASGWSWALKQTVTYVLSEGIEQPVSTIVAQQGEADPLSPSKSLVAFAVRADNLVPLDCNDLDFMTLASF